VALDPARILGPRRVYSVRVYLVLQTSLGHQPCLNAVLGCAQYATICDRTCKYADKSATTPVPVQGSDLDVDAVMSSDVMRCRVRQINCDTPCCSDRAGVSGGVILLQISFFIVGIRD
jgi:hypothetical protein